jgi:hypothetical protein
MLLDGLFSQSNPNQTTVGFTPQEMGLLGYSLATGGNVNPILAMALLNDDKPQQRQPFNPYPAPEKMPPQPLGQTSPANVVDNIMQAIGQVESSGRYDAMGPTTKSGDRAYGRYQVMGNNIPAWSKEALGYSVTPDDFIKNPELQDQIARYKMGQYHGKYGNPQDVASMWFSGRPMRNNVSADVTGTNVPEYVRRVNKYL